MCSCTVLNPNVCKLIKDTSKSSPTDQAYTDITVLSYIKLFQPFHETLYTNINDKKGDPFPYL